MKCFVIMPFSETEHIKENKKVKITSNQWTFIFNEWIKKAVENYSEKKINCKRSNTIPGNFVKGIVQDIFNSELSIVDLTGQKPNVYYELGIRHSLRLGTIIITQDFNALPSDLKSYYCFEYKYSDKTHYNEEYYKVFENNLHLKIKAVIENYNQSDNPVSDFLNLNYYVQVQEKEKLNRKLEVLMGELIDIFSSTFDIIDTLLAKKEKFLEEKSVFFTFFDLSYIDYKISNLLNFDYDYIPDGKVTLLRKYYLEFRKEMVIIYQYWEGTRQHISISNLKQLFELMERFSKRKNEYMENLGFISAQIIVEYNGYTPNENPSQK